MFFFSQGTNLEKYALTVLDYINFCSRKYCAIRTFPNQIIWLNSEVRSLLHERDAAIRSVDLLVYVAPWEGPEKIIKASKIIKISKAKE